MFKSVFALLIFYSLSSYSAIYKCKVDGVTTFSQSPCGDTSQEVKVIVRNSTSKQAPHSQTSVKTATNDVDQYLINQEIKRRNKNINRYKLKLNKELAVLKERTYYARNNLAGATYQNALSQEMVALTNKYKTLIDDEKRQISTLKSKTN